VTQPPDFTTNDYPWYGGMPPHEATDTSFQAARAALPHVGPWQYRIWAWTYSRARHGTTDEETADATGCNPNTLHPRRGELEKKLGLIIDSGRRRMTRGNVLAIVWVCVEFADPPTNGHPAERIPEGPLVQTALFEEGNPW